MVDLIDDPIDTPEERAAEFRAHARTYYGFLHLVRWFVVHIGLLLIAIYGFMIGQGAVALVLVALAVAALTLGIMTTNSDAKRKVSHLPPAVDLIQRG